MTDPGVDITRTLNGLTLPYSFRRTPTTNTLTVQMTLLFRPDTVSVSVLLSLFVPFLHRRIYKVSLLLYQTDFSSQVKDLIFLGLNHLVLRVTTTVGSRAYGDEHVCAYHRRKPPAAEKSRRSGSNGPGRTSEQRDQARG